MKRRVAGRTPRSGVSGDPGDPLYHAVSMKYVRRHAVLGVAVHFESNSAAAMRAVDAAFGRRKPGDPLRGGSGTIRIRLVVHRGNEGPGRRVPITYRLPDSDRVVMHTRGSLAIADARRLEGIAYITPAFLRQREHLCFGLLEPLVLVLVTRLDRQPVHASVVGRWNAALVLAGPAGTGKSTLAYAAMRRGMTLFADDGAYIQVQPTFRLWAMPGRLYLPVDTRRWFPELGGHRPQRLATGKTKMAVKVIRSPGDHEPVARLAGVCLLERGGGPVRVSQVGAASLQRALWNGLGAQQPIYRATAEPALMRLCAGGGWRLTLGGDPREAVTYLERMLEEVARRAKVTAFGPAPDAQAPR